MCVSYRSEFNTNCVIVRPGHIYGPTAGEKDNRVSSLFMYSAARNQNLIMKSKGEQIRSYCYCLDTASAILIVLFLGKTCDVYNISNKDSICTIKEMAMQFAKEGKVNLEIVLPTNNEKQAFNPMLNSSLNSKKLESLGWKPQFSLETGVKHSIEIIKEIYTNQNM